jgi:E1A/CREB-binding protein
MSDFIEARIHASLTEERKERAQSMNLDVELVPPVADLHVRVVQSTEKTAETKPQFEAHYSSTHNYPRAFKYRQKVMCLFQQVEGVDVLLFCMYVHEYGSEQDAPNTRTIYLSYLDSIKYLRPEIEACGRGGISIRTMIYHDILLGYLEWARRRGFNAMYIWACPPMAGDDYIMYCHPSRQKTPRSDKLRDWYLRMLRTGYEQGKKKI